MVEKRERNIDFDRSQGGFPLNLNPLEINRIHHPIIYCLIMSYYDIIHAIIACNCNYSLNFIYIHIFITQF